MRPRNPTIFDAQFLLHTHTHILYIYYIHTSIMLFTDPAYRFHEA